MKKRILSILLLCCMVLTMLPAPAFAADEEAYALPPDTGGLCEHHPEHDEACGYTPQTEDAAGTPCDHVCEIRESGDSGADPVDPAGTSGDMTPMPLLGAARPAATQYTYTLHYDANGGSGAPPSESKISSKYQASFLISDKIPTRDGYTFKAWADSPYGEPKYLRADGYYWYCDVVNGQTNSKTIYAIWEVHNHNWGEWISNDNGTHTRTCTTDSSHTETGSCSGGKATSTERAVCETCRTAYGELFQPVKTVITTPPTLRLPAYVGNEYTDAALMGGEARTEGTDTVVPGSFRFRDYAGGRVHPGENHMVILFTPDDTEAYTTAECTITVMGTKRTITSVPYDVYINDKMPGTAFENLGLPAGVNVETNTGANYSPIPVTWDGSTYDPNRYGEQIITGELHVERSRYTDHLEPTSTVKATARIRLIDNRVFTPTLEPPVYSKQLYGGDLCFLVFADKYLSGGTATANGEPVSGKFTLDKDQKIYGHSLTASTLLQAGQLQLKVIFTPDNLKRYTKAECTVDVNVIPRKYMYSNASYIDNRKIGTPFAELNLSDSFSFYAVGDEKDPEGTGMDFGMNVVTSWDASTYNPNSFEEQTIYGEVNRAELEKYFTIPESTDLRAVRKVQLQPDPVETEITQVPVFHWRNGNYTLPDNTIFTWRKLQVGTYNAEVGTLVGGAAKVKGADTVAPGTFSFKNTPPFYLQTPGEHDVTVVFTPDDPRLHKPTETTIKISAIKNTIRDTDKPDPITDKPIGTSFAALGLPKTVCINAVDDAWRWINVAWDASSYDAQSPDWQIITGTLLLDEDDDSIFQQPEPAVTAAIRVKLTVPDSPPTVTTETLPGGTIGVAYSQRLFANGTEPITWHVTAGELPNGLNLNEATGEISGTPTTEETATFTVRALNSVGNDKKELSITITNAPAAEHTVTVTNDGNGTASASPAKAAAGTEIALTATPGTGYHLKEWQVMSGGVTIKDNKFTMPNANVEVKAVFEEDVPAPTEFTITVKTDGNGTASASHEKAVVGTEITLTATPNTGYHFKEWQVMSGGVTIKDNKFTMPNDNVEVRAIFEEDAPPAPTEFTITVKTDGKGTASASHAKAVAGTEIRLTATPKTGYHFKEWEVISGGVAIENNKFLMPEGNVAVKAIFEKDAPPAPTEFIVTFDGNGGTPSVGSMTTTNRKLTSLPSASRSGSYSFDGWYTEKSGGTKVTTDTVFSANTTVYAHWTYIGGGGGGYNPPVTYYTLRFETGGGSDIPSVRETYNAYIDLTQYVPTWRGHTFIGWYSERGLMNKVSGVYLTKDMTVYALWRVDENPSTGANPFTDVSEKDWFYGDVMFVYENGLMLGTSKTLFSPHGTATRGMMATILWRMEGSPVPKGKNSFTDVEAGKWYADAITWTAENGIFAGYGKDKFGPDDPITREQLAAIFYRYADYKGYDLTVKGNLDKFKDADKITDYAKTAMQWAVGSGLMKGKSGNLLDPQGTATRAEIAAMLHRFIEKYELVQGKAPGGLMGWIDPKRLQIPKTGDSSVLGLWGFSLCTSLAGCLALTTWQIRRRREEEALQIIEK